MAVMQALREWFEAVRSGSEGVRGAQLVDAVVTLGLNHDYKQVRMRFCTVGNVAKQIYMLHPMVRFGIER